MVNETPVDTAAVAEDTAPEPVDEQPAAEVETSEPTETSPVDAETETASADEPTETEQRPAPTLSDEEIQALIRERGLEDRIRESERQKFQQQQRREAGKKDSVTRAVDQFLDRVGVEVEDKSQLGFLYDLAKGTGTYEMLGEYAQHLADAGRISNADLRRALEARESDGLLPYFEALQEADARARSEALSLDDIERLPAESKTRKAMEQWFQKRWDAEQQAQKLAAQKRNPPPPVAPGQGSAGTLNIQTLDDAEDAYNDGKLSHSQYKELRRKFGVAEVPR